MKAGVFREAFRVHLCQTCLFAGTCGLLAGVASGSNALWLVTHSVTATGTVVNVRAAHDDKENSVFYTPVFAFKAQDGQTYTVASDTGSNTPSFAPGQQVPVRYIVSRPAAAKIATFGQLWLAPVVFGAAGVIFTAIGRLLLRSLRRRDPQFKPFGSPRRTSPAPRWPR